MTDKELLEEIRKLVNPLPRRGSEREKALTINKIQLLLLDPHDPKIVPCPACGHALDISWEERSTHVETGYREPHIKPYLPGSYLWKEEQE